MPSSKADTTIVIPSVDVEAYVTSTMSWIAVHWLQIAIAAGVGAGIFLGLNALKRFGKRFQPKAGETMGWSEIMGRIAAKTNQFFIVMASARLVAGYAVPPPTVATTINFLWTVAAVFQGAIWMREIILGLIERRTEGQGATAGTGSAIGIIRMLISIALFAIASIVVLDNLGVNVTGLVAGLGIGGIAIGLAAQGIFSDLFAALSMIFDKPFRRGDFIGYGSTKGTVQRIGLKTTRIRSQFGEKKVIGNADLLKNEITNFTGRAFKRQRWVLGLIYQTDPEVAARLPAILKEIVEAAGARFDRAAFVNFNASSIDFELDFDIMKPNAALVDDVTQKVGIGILRRFAAEGIEFAYPTQTAFTAAPSGRMIMPYPGEPAEEPEPTAETPAAPALKPARKRSIPKSSE